MWEKVRGLFQQGAAASTTKTPPARMAQKEPHIENGRLIWANNIRELDQIRHDPNLEAKVKQALANLHKKLSAGYKGEPIEELFKAGANDDTVVLKIDAFDPEQDKKIFLEAKLIRFDGNGETYRTVLYEKEQELLNSLLLPQTLVDTKTVIHTAYEYAYSDMHS